MENTSISHERLVELGLTQAEFDSICTHLGRTPNAVELSVFSVMWSEHCSYKSSRKYLKQFPTTGPRVIQGPGENAGVVDIGDGDVAVFKMESHNHPSFIEPYQGAGTGVGGILRDVFTMGADPVLLMNSLRFGETTHPKTSYLVEGAVSGIAGYGNCFGCPTSGGEVFFHPSFNANPLVNAFCLGVAKKDRVFYGRAKGIGNPVIYVGSKTGRDGIHGATMASQEFDDHAESKRPTVQVGDPFAEKLLLEACLELMQQPYLIGIQDMGAAGLTCSSVEMASRSGSGIRIDLSKVPARETEMTAEDFLLSESQERMLLVVEKGKEKEALAIFEKWDLEGAVIGEVTNDGYFRALFRGKEELSIPVQALTEAAPVYDRPVKADAKSKSQSVTMKKKQDYTEDLKILMGSANLSSREWVYRQYDHQVKLNSVVNPGGDAAVVRLKGTPKGLAVSTDSNSRHCQIDPFLGAQMAVCEAARNVSCVGAEPVGLTDCLNFASPENPSIMWQFKRTVEGIREACLALDIPVVSGNVSFYNETNGKPIYPTPTIGVVGLIKNMDNLVGHSFQSEGDLICVVGENDTTNTKEVLGGSEYVATLYGSEDGELPPLHIDLEAKVQGVIRDMIGQGLVCSAHDCSDGGLAVALAESCFEHEVGATVEYNKKTSSEMLLFGESPSRVVVSLSPENKNQLELFLKKKGVPYQFIGTTGGEQLVFNEVIGVEIRELKQVWKEGFGRHVFKKRA